MRETPSLGMLGFVGLALVAAIAGVTRGGYLAACCDYGAQSPRLLVQGQGPALDFAPGTLLRGQSQPTEFDNLVHNLREHRWFGSLAPLADKEEQTAHVAPGYFWLASFAPSATEIRYCQTFLSWLTVVVLFFFARQAFASNLAAFAVGLLAAIHPFWIVNEAELADGTLTTFLLAAVLYIGGRAVVTGGPLSSALFGLSLAALALTRAALLPFSFVALGWFLIRCRGLKLGWFAGLLALLGFGNGLAPWSLRCYQMFHDPLPVANSTYLHLWMGNLPGASGGPVDEAARRKSLPAERLKSLLDETNQAKRYRRLSHDVWNQVRNDPASAVSCRIGAGLRFLFGDAWFQNRTMVDQQANSASLPTRVAQGADFVCQAAILALLLAGVLGWRLSQPHAEESRLAALALIVLPLPYLLSHGEWLSGPRLPWDAVLVCFAGYAIAWVFPATRQPSVVISEKRLPRADPVAMATTKFK